MKNKDAIETLKYLKGLVPELIEAAVIAGEIPDVDDTIYGLEKTLTQSQEKPSVNLDDLLFEISDSIKETHGKDTALMMHPLIGRILRYLSEQGYLGATVVPEEPTKQMLIAGVKAHLQGAADMNDMAYIQHIYKAMINAAKKD